MTDDAVHSYIGFSHCFDCAKSAYNQLSAERDALKAEVVFLSDLSTAKISRALNGPEIDDFKAQLRALRVALFAVARKHHNQNDTEHVIHRFTECNHRECEAVHNLLGDMPHPTEAELKAALEGSQAPDK